MMQKIPTHLNDNLQMLQQKGLWLNNRQLLYLKNMDGPEVTSRDIR